MDDRMNTMIRTSGRIATVVATATVLAVAGCQSVPEEPWPRAEIPAPAPIPPAPEPPVIVQQEEPQVIDLGAAPSTAAGIISSPPVVDVAQEPVGDSVVYIRDESDFYVPLEPYGHWISIYPYGRCWYPRGVSTGWRPYCNGNWVYSTSGWCWRSPEPWGWATYHYGRWMYTGGYGWVWVPLTTWAPSWVCWRQCDDYIGWAPMPPYDLNYHGGSYYWPDAYCYVPASRFVEPVTPETVIVASTPPAAQPVVIVNEPPPKSRIERATERAIARIETRLLRIEAEGTFAQRHPALAMKAAEILAAHLPAAAARPKGDIVIGRRSDSEETDLRQPVRSFTRGDSPGTAGIVDDGGAAQRVRPSVAPRQIGQPRASAPEGDRSVAAPRVSRQVTEPRVVPAQPKINLNAEAYRQWQPAAPRPVAQPQPRAEPVRSRPAVENYRVPEWKAPAPVVAQPVRPAPAPVRSYGEPRREPSAAPARSYVESRREQSVAPIRQNVVQRGVEVQVKAQNTAQNTIQNTEQQRSGTPVRQSMAQWRDEQRRDGRR